jgi:glycosyltransferase involved in cell wall biosynthesis
MQNPSVIIACYNDGGTLPRAIESALPRPTIVVNDGSVDNTEEVCSLYPVTYVKIDHSGVPAARNAGLKRVTTPWFICLDADDELLALPSTSVENNVGVIYGNYRVGASKLLPNKNITLEALERDNQLYQSSMVRTAAAEEVGFYWDDNWLGDFYPEDWDLWLRLMAAGWVFKYVDVDFVKYAQRRNSVWNTALMQNKAEPGKQRILFHYHQWRTSHCS